MQIGNFTIDYLSSRIIVRENQSSSSWELLLINKYRWNPRTLFTIVKQPRSESRRRSNFNLELPSKKSNKKYVSTKITEWLGNLMNSWGISPVGPVSDPLPGVNGRDSGARDQTTTPNFYLARLDGALAPDSGRYYNGETPSESMG